MEVVLDELRDSHRVIAEGTMEEKKAFARAFELNLDDAKVAFHHVDGRDADARFSVWSAADIFCSLSDNIQESFGLTVIEANGPGVSMTEALPVTVPEVATMALVYVPVTVPAVKAPVLALIEPAVALPTLQTIGSPVLALSYWSKVAAVKV